MFIDIIKKDYNILIFCDKIYLMYLYNKFTTIMVVLNMHLACVAAIELTCLNAH